MIYLDLKYETLNDDFTFNLDKRDCNEIISKT